MLEDLDDKHKAIMINKEMAKLRRNISRWKEMGIFKKRNGENIGKEKKMWYIMGKMNNEIPKMRMIIKAHKKDLAIRNICPKDQTWTTGVSKALVKLLDKMIEKEMESLGYENKNITDIMQWGENIDGCHIDDNEDIIVCDVKEMFNEIDNELLVDIILRNVDNEICNKKQLKK